MKLTEWREITKANNNKDIEVGDVRDTFIDGIGCFDVKVVAFTKDEVSLIEPKPDVFKDDTVYTTDYEYLGCTSQEADEIMRRIDEQERTKDDKGSSGKVHEGM